MFYCPKCRSQEIFPVAGGYIGSIYLCKDCGYRGSFVIEVDSPEAIREMEKDTKEHP